MKDYVAQATRTESLDHFKVDHPRLLHAAIGMSTEMVELLLADDNDTVNVKEELGDILWYVAIAADSLKIGFNDFGLLADIEALEDDPIRAIMGATGDALDCIKRAIYYGLPLDEVKFARATGTVQRGVEILARDEGWSLADLQVTNIAKLARRYPSKFTPEKALNRDLEEEMKVLRT